MSSPVEAGTAKRQPVWLSGATGFIGRHLQDALHQAGVPVRALVRPGSKRVEHLHPRSERVSAHLHERAAIVASLRGCRAVIYAAGTVRGRHLRDFSAANVAGVENLVQALALVRPAPPVLLISSLAATQPQLSYYAHSKAEGEAKLRAASGLDWTILRPPAVYGPGDVEMRPIFRLLRSGWALRPGPPEQRIALLHVQDLAFAVLAWLAAPSACTSRSFNIDDGHQHAGLGGYAWEEMASAAGNGRCRLWGVPRWLLDAAARLNVTLSHLLRYQPMLTPGKGRELQHPTWICDNSPFSGLTGWRPKVDLGMGLDALFGVGRTISGPGSERH